MNSKSIDTIGVIGVIGWIIAIILSHHIKTLNTNAKIADMYIHELEIALEDEDVCIEDVCDKCLDYHNIADN